MASLNNQRINGKINAQKRSWKTSIDKKLRESVDGTKISYRNGKSGKFCGLQRTTQDTSVDLVTIRAQQTLRSKKVKPSMPKMPWDV